MERGIFLVQDYLRDSAARLPSKVALVCDPHRITYAQLEAASNALARALRRRGVARGDRVIVFAENSAATAISFWGVLKADAVVSMVNAGTKADKLAWLLNDCRATALLAPSHLAPAFVPAARRSPHLRAVMVAGELPAADLPGLCSFMDAMADEGDGPAPVRRAIDIDLAAIIYTSGSTGEPKGVMLTHRNMLAAAASITAYLENVEDDVILGALPLSFDYGLYQMIMAFKTGARLVLQKSFAFPARVLEDVVREGVTGFPGVPTMFATMAEMENLPGYDFSKVRYVTNTAAALPF
ncbi:MAG: class I adenylate-forming enzyme family protein, partial [Myxococcales bacterium]